MNDYRFLIIKNFIDDPIIAHTKFEQTAQILFQRLRADVVQV